MCDTIVAMPGYTKNGKMLFAKNSDRHPNEPQFLQHFKAKDYTMSGRPYVELTYIVIPQVAHTYEITISRPSWMWGGEFGFNEFGLNIGNEAVFTKEKYIKGDGITGMDMLRLALERCKTAVEALYFLIVALEKYPQGGNCGYGKSFYYHNSFLIADGNDAYVLETAGKYWAYKKVKDYFAISNCLCLSDYDECHPELIENAIKRHWCKSKEDFDFVKCYSEPVFTNFAKGRQRRAMAMEKLSKGSPDIKSFIGIMRSHGGRAKDGFAEVGSICMHAGGLIGDNTTASYVAEIDGNDSLYFVTESSMPCISIYKPLSMCSNHYIAEEGQENRGVEFWLNREKLMRYFISGTMPINEFRQQGRVIEEMCIDDFVSARPDERLAVSENGFEQEERLVMRNLTHAKTLQISFTRGSLFYRLFWKHATKKLISTSIKNKIKA